MQYTIHVSIEAMLVNFYLTILVIYFIFTVVSYSYYMIRKLKFGFISDGIVPIFLSLFIEKAMAKVIYLINIISC